jgi:UDP-N-acetyl-D-mannosaminuronate dehydrogenase
VVRDADVLLLLVGHKEFKLLDPSRLKKLTSARIVIDAVGAWEVKDWLKAGFSIFRLGEGRSH